MTMRAWVVAPDGRPGLVRTERPVPTPGRTSSWSECRCAGCAAPTFTSRSASSRPRRARAVPGHEVVGRVTRSAGGAASRPGDRVGVAWLRSTCGRCRWCRRGAENLCPDARFTGWDADGGYAEYAVVPAAFAYALPTTVADDEAPRRCCARASSATARCASVPPGGRLGIYGFGAPHTSPPRSPCPGRRSTS